jgi:hypothetical protein
MVPPQVVYFGPTEENEDSYQPVNSLMRATEQSYAVRSGLAVCQMYGAAL